MTVLSSALTPKRILTLRSRTKDGALRELASAVSLGGSRDRESLLRAIRERERVLGSWIAPGVAIPHVKIAGWEGIEVAVGRSRRGVRWDSSDGNPVNLLILVVSGDSEPDRHVLLLAEIARTLHDRALLQLILTARTPIESYRLLTMRGHSAQDQAPSSAKLRLSRLLFAHALSVAEEVKARAVLLHADAVGSLRFIEDIPAQTRLILVSSSKPEPATGEGAMVHRLQVPFLTMDRHGQVDLALLLAVSRGMLSRGDTVVSLSGVPSSGSLDTLLVIDVGREFPTVFARSSVAPLGDVEPQVLEKVLQIAAGIAREGREGRPVGTVFVVGDYDHVLLYCRQLVINPFHGYGPEEKSILDPSLEETVKEFSTIDGAFVIRGDGVIMSAGTFLRPERSVPNLPSGLGARHAAAAALSQITASLAVVVSQSAGRVSLFKGGGLVMSLAKPGTAAG